MEILIALIVSCFVIGGINGFGEAKKEAAYINKIEQQQQEILKLKQ